MASQTVIADITKILEEKKQKLEEELAHFAKKNPRAVGDFDADFPQYGDKEDENAAEVAEYSHNLTLERTLEGELRDVVSALARIGRGEYGVCKYCKNPISEARLMARPTSSACIECKKTILQEA